MQSIERRIDIRKAPEHLSYLSLPLDNGGIVTDLSVGGLGFRAVAPVKAGGPMEVQFAMNSAARITAVGELAWIDETGRLGGLRFTQLSDEAREQIRVWAGQPNEKARVQAGVMLDDVQISEPAFPARIAPAGRDDSIRAGSVNRLLYNLRPPVYSAPFYELSMFPLEQKSEARAANFTELSSLSDLLSFAVNHPIPAVGLTIALALLVSIGIFAYVAANREGQSLFDWSEKTMGGSSSQPAAQEISPPMNSAADSPRAPLR